MKVPKVSVIIPVYKAEKYIEQCVRSLFEQSLDEIEFIFIDDCGGDDSINIITRILEKYPTRQSQVKIIHHDINLGVGQSRQDGIDVATGEFIIHCDADDWVDHRMYQKLYQAAKDHNADIVACGYTEVFLTKEINHSEFVPKTKYDRVKAIIDGKLHGSLWNKLVRKKLYTTAAIKFEPDICFWEDLGAAIRFFYIAVNVININECLYYYRRNDESATASLNEAKVYSMIAVAKDSINFLKGTDDKINFTPIIQQLAFNSKKNLLITGNGCYNPKKWRETFPEYNRYVFKIRATPLVRLFYILAICHIDFISRIYVSRPPFLLKIKHFLLR